MLTDLTKLMLLSFILVFSSLAIADENELYDISQHYLKKASKFGCQSIELEIKRIEKVKQQKLVDELKQEAAQLKELVNSDDTEDEIKLQIQELEALIQDNNRKIKIKEKLKHLCSFIARPLRFSANALSISNSLLLHTALLPFNSVASFLNTLWQAGSYDESTDFIYHAMSPKRSIPLYTLSNIAYQTPMYAFGVSPALLIMNASIMTEMISYRQCERQALLSAEMTQYCHNYNRVRGFFGKVQNKIKKRTSQLSTNMAARKMQRRMIFDNQKFCRLSSKKQIKRAQSAINRFIKVNTDSRIHSLEILAPVHHNNCTQIIMRGAGNEVTSLKNDYPELEGINILVLNQFERPNTFYSQDEIEAKSFTEQLCLGIEENKMQEHSYRYAKLINDFSKIALAPSMLSTPSINKVIIEDDQLVLANSLKGENIILSIGVSDDEQNTLNQLLNEQSKLNKLIKNDYQSLIKSRNYQQCIKRARKIKLPIDIFEQALVKLNVINQSDLLKKHIESKAIENFFNKFKRRYKLEWKLIKTNDIDTAHHYLKSDKINNLVIIGHGKTMGHLVDGRQQEYPRESFSQISSSLMSLNFYSCHSAKSTELYQIEMKLKSMHSQHKVRYFSYVAENDFLDANYFAPISAFHHYLLKLDDYLYQANRGSQKVQQHFAQRLRTEAPNQQCQIDLSDLKVSRGSYAIVLNDQLIATKDQLEASKKAHFNCNILNDQNNQLRIKSVYNQHSSQIENLNDFTLFINEQAIHASMANFRRASLINILF